MIPQPNQYVILVLYNGVRLDGNVVEWADRIVLTSKTNSITTVVPDTTDVLYYQVIETEAKYETIKAKPLKGPEEIQELAKLKNELTMIEKEQIANKFRTHEISGNLRLNHYELPNLSAIKIPAQHSTKEVRREHSSVSSSLQGLFGKK